MSYYCTTRAFHPCAPNTCVPRSWDLMANFDAFAYKDMTSPRPLLMITGTKTATKRYSEGEVTKAKKFNELVILDGRTHADLYGQIDDTGSKLVGFSGKTSFRREVRAIPASTHIISTEHAFYRDEQALQNPDVVYSMKSRSSRQ